LQRETNVPEAQCHCGYRAVGFCCRWFVIPLLYGVSLLLFYGFGFSHFFWQLYLYVVTGLPLDHSKRTAFLQRWIFLFLLITVCDDLFLSSRSSSKKQPVIDSSKPLPPQATFRGPYINTGSRDVGPDHQTYPKK